jgi:hyaluronoglucosaminidase
LAAAPERIRTRVTDPGFVADTGPWLDATALWGRAFVATLDALDARLAGDPGTADAHFAEADGLVARAQSITTIAGETRPQGTVRVADGVLDTFLGEAHGLA